MQKDVEGHNTHRNTQNVSTLHVVAKGISKQILHQTRDPAAAAYQVDLADFFEPKLGSETEFDEFQSKIARKNKTSWLCAAQVGSGQVSNLYLKIAKILHTSCGKIRGQACNATKVCDLSLYPKN